MCVVSMIMDQWGPWIPQPLPLPLPQPTNVPPVVSPLVAPPYTNEHLRELLDSLQAAIEAAETLDRLTGQPDCVDPEKAKLLERVEELERRLAALENGE